MDVNTIRRNFVMLRTRIFLPLNLNTILGGVLLLAVSTAAHSDDYQSTHQSGLYIGADVGYISADNACSDIYNSCDENNFKFGIIAGARFNEYVSLELAYQDFGTYEGKLNVIDDTDAFGVDLQIKADWWLSHNMNIFGKLGGMRWDKSFHGHIENGTSPDMIDQNGYSPTFSLGAEYEILNNLNARLSYQWVNDFGGDETTLNLFSLGLTYKFI